jgi:transcriptional regulator with XRE-family HTH domain
MGELGMTAKTLANAAEVDPGTVSDLLAGKRWPQAKSRAKIERALEWPAGTLADIAAGGPLPPQRRPSRPTTLQEARDLAERAIIDSREIPEDEKPTLLLAIRLRYEMLMQQDAHGAADSG